MLCRHRVYGIENVMGSGETKGEQIFLVVVVVVVVVVLSSCTILLFHVIPLVFR